MSSEPEAVATLRQASAVLARMAKTFQQEARRVESLGQLDAQSTEALANAKALLGGSDEEGRCG